MALAEPLGTGYLESPVERWQNGRLTQQRDCVAEEVPVALVYNGIPHVVMLATPKDLEVFALGFSLSEEIIVSPSEMESIQPYRQPEGIEVRMKIPEERFIALHKKRRNLTGRTGCGLCGAQTLRQAVRRPPPVGRGVTLSTQELHEALNQLSHLQFLNGLTGAVHAAAWITPGQGVRLLCEDVGRHNALDKLIGTLARQRIDFAAGFVIVTSRASYEMVQKAATVGITLLAAISAPTGLAIRLAEETGLTLIGFARSRNHVIYANPQRLTRS